MDNMFVYNAVRKVPQFALKEIKGGRMNGKSDINPMWRLQTLTEQFGICGFGWKYEIVRQWLEIGSNEEVAAFCNINLFVKMDGVWSDAIPGTGGSAFVAKEKAGLYTSDECYKMALTDAISVACKALGVAADIYWNNPKSKYEPRQEKPTSQQEKPTMQVNPSEEISKPTPTQLKSLLSMAMTRGVDLSVKGKEWTGKKSIDWDMTDYLVTKNQLEKMGVSNE